MGDWVIDADAMRELVFLGYFSETGRAVLIPSVIASCMTAGNADVRLRSHAS